MKNNLLKFFIKKLREGDPTPNRMGCGATWVSLQGWGGRGNLGFPTPTTILHHYVNHN
jgi:hypothetical protein